MKNTTRPRAFVALLLIMCLFGTPLMAFGKKGEKNYKKGLEYEAAQQWEKAAEEYTLALAANPSDTEYQLHYRRATFNASQALMQRGRSLMEEKDYIGAYNAYRQAYAYDQVNELAKNEMARALRMQNDREQMRASEGNATPPPTASNGVQVRPTAFRTDEAAVNAQPTAPRAPRAEELRTFIWNNQDLKFIIRKLAEELNLNVIFDPDTFRQQRNVDLTLKNVTVGQTLDYLFLQEGLFFQKLSRRTILVANQTRRAQFQQLVLRTFYLSNVEPEAARALIQQAIPPNQGRPSTIALVDKGSNSLTVRDTSENIKLIENLIRSIDKDRAEVVMDVQIYEVSRNDVLQIGNQVGNGSSLTLGGTSGVAALASNGRGQGSAQVALQTVAQGIPTALGSALILPASTFTAFQSKGNTKLLASTQIHAFNGEESQARIGQRVPVQTAQTYPFGFNGNTGTGGGTNGNNFGGGFPVIQYEPVGLTLKFTPTVFPNQDVQVKMNIESKDVGGSSLTPTFTERTISGTARIQNNRTMMLASVAQNRASDGRAGLPFVSALPVLGRLFTSPRKANDQVDIVIAVTPRVLRAPAISPEDESERDSGTLQMPTSGSIAEVVDQAEREEAQLAMANRPSESPSLVTLGAADAVEYVPASRPATPAAQPPDVIIEVANANVVPGATMQPVSVPAAQPATGTVIPPQLNVQQAVQQMVNGKQLVNASAPAPQPKDQPEQHHGPVVPPTAPPPAPVATVVPSVVVAPPTVAANDANVQAMLPTLKVVKAAEPVAGNVELSLLSEATELRAGMRQRIAVALETDATLASALVALKFDPAKIRVIGLTQGNAGNGVATELMQRIQPNGEVSVFVMPQNRGQLKPGASVLFYVEVEALAAGENALNFNATSTRLTTASNQAATLRFAPTGLVVK